jgi:hypothetical protein
VFGEVCLALMIALSRVFGRKKVLGGVPSFWKEQGKPNYSAIIAGFFAGGSLAIRGHSPFVFV